MNKNAITIKYIKLKNQSTIKYKKYKLSCQPQKFQHAFVIIYIVSFNKLSQIIVYWIQGVQRQIRAKGDS